MPKLLKVTNPRPGEATWMFDCPGCNMSHGIWTEQNSVNPTPVWQFNGDINSPTISPSILVRYPHKGILVVCHSFIRNGRIEYLSDSTHALSGKTVELPEQ